MLSDSDKGEITEVYLFTGHALDFCENRVRLELNNDNILDHGSDNCRYDFDTIESKSFAYRMLLLSLINSPIINPNQETAKCENAPYLQEE